MTERPKREMNPALRRKPRTELTIERGVCYFGDKVFMLADIVHDVGWSGMMRREICAKYGLLDEFGNPEKWVIKHCLKEAAVMIKSMTFVRKR